MTNKLTKNNKGFSLVELIVVIAIMAVLIGALAPQFIKFVEKSRVSTDIQNMEEVKTAIQTYAAENGYTADTWSIGSTSGTQDFTADATNHAFINAALTDAGLNATFNFKSKNWTGVTVTVDATNNKVTVVGSNGTGTNLKTLSDGAGTATE